MHGIGNWAAIMINAGAVWVRLRVGQAAQCICHAADVWGGPGVWGWGPHCRAALPTCLVLGRVGRGCVGVLEGVLWVGMRTGLRMWGRTGVYLCLFVWVCVFVGLLRKRGL